MRHVGRLFLHLLAFGLVCVLELSWKHLTPPLDSSPLPPVRMALWEQRPLDAYMGVRPPFTFTQTWWIDHEYVKLLPTVTVVTPPPVLRFPPQ
ncbi:MAG: hypothetical protein COY40_02405 [Alphaproteobacteria bacterium CG_4_10_14_0_8_um_filter_53_9]|nr:MAG: hypothetical protein COY40_02405 [Alphaproteobacteria bacterium CG_4_10_14_0_8_um_filter_53_9]